MKKILTILCSLMMIMSFSLPTYAMDNTYSESTYYDTSNISENMNELDPYIKVIDNQYVMDLPQNIILSEELNQEVTQQLNSTNKFILENDYIIGDDKVAKPRISTRAYGSTYVHPHWNYLEIGLDAGVVSAIVSAGVGSGVTVLITMVPAVAAWIASVGAATGNIAIGAIVSFIVSIAAGQVIKDGIIIHYNFFYQRVNYFAWQ